MSRPVWLVVLGIAIPWLSGCAGTYRSLPSEDVVAELAELKRAAADMPQQTHRVAVPQAPGRRPVRVAVHETAATRGRGDRVVVLVHGVMSDSAVWRYLRGAIGDQYDLMAVDLVGCGDSDRPDPRDRGPDGYAPPALARDVLAALRERLAARDAAAGGLGALPARVTLVGHSLGGSVVLRMLCDDEVSAEYGDVLSRVDGAVLFTPADVAVDPNQPTFRAVATVTDLEVAIGRLLGVVPRRVERGTLDCVTEPRLAVREEAERTESILVDRPRRRAAAAMLRQALPLRAGCDDRLDWDRVDELAAAYARVRVPCLIVWGGRDEVLPVSMGYKLAAEIPDARLRVVSAGMHCLPVERPRECASLLRDFVDGRGELTGGRQVARLDLSARPPFLVAADPPHRPDHAVATTAVADERLGLATLFHLGRAERYVWSVAGSIPPLSFFALPERPE